MKIAAKQAVCVGSGQCVFADPDAFDQDDDGKVLVLRDTPVTDAELAAAHEAVQVCPSRALSLTSD